MRAVAAGSGRPGGAGHDQVAVLAIRSNRTLLSRHLAPLDFENRANPSILADTVGTRHSGRVVYENGPFHDSVGHR